MKRGFPVYLFCLAIPLALGAWKPGVRSHPPAKYLSPQVPVAQRVEDLLARMTLTEKIGQMCQFVGIEHMKATALAASKNQPLNKDAYSLYPGYTPQDIADMVKNGVIGSFLHVVTLKEANALQALAQSSRLKIPLLIGIDAIHGNGMVAGSTIYPSPIGMAATWDTSLVKRMARYTAAEMRATGSQWAFSPNLDIARDARWGRVGETYGEDPYLVTQMGDAMITGLQGKLNSTQDVLACAKHLVGGSQPLNGLNVAPTDISERTLHEVFLPPYEAAVKAGVYTVMPAHNELNGVPSHANKELMTGLLRNQWDFKGFYISDFMDIERLALVHGTAFDQDDAVEQTVVAGMDMHMHGPGFLEAVLKLINEGKIPVSRIDESVRRILAAKFRLGLFDAPYVEEKNQLQQLNAPAHRATALEAARKSIVLVKNDQLLPLSARYKKILVVGPNANNQSLLGDWSLRQPENQITTVWQGMKQLAPQGCQIAYYDVGGSTLKLEAEKIAQAAAQAASADLTVVVVGENALRFAGKDRTSGENVDRDNIDLLGEQLALVQQISQAGKPVVVVLINGRPLSIPWIDAHVPAIVEAWEPGQAGGQAIAEILFGNVNPSGKLPISTPRSVGQIPVYYNHKPSAYVRQYVGVANTPLYEFGYGLSYTTFAITDIAADKKEISPGENLRVTSKLRNTGKITGDEVIQLYLHSPANGITRPVKELKSFVRASLAPGESKNINFELTPELLAGYNSHMQKEIAKGVYTVLIGNSSRDKDLQTLYFTVK
ncbi:MAG: glycoside hydrolase family 3 N-terminal domain-containing protein [Janthinobacterium lividum]